MKNFKVKWLLLSIILSVASINTAWGYWHVPGDHAGAGWTSADGNDSQMNSENYVTFYAVGAGTYEFQLVKGSTWGHGNIYNNSTDLLENVCSNCQNGHNKFTVKTGHVVDITFHIVNETNWDCDVSAVESSYFIKYPWDGGGYNWSAQMVSNDDGTYSVHGGYGGKSYNYGRRGYDGGADTGYKENAATIVGDQPKNGDKCIFTYKPADHSLSIRKASTVTHTNYFYFDNTSSQWTNTYTYFVFGTPERSTMYGSMTNIANTQLKYGNNSSDDWTDVSYYAMAAGNSAWDNGHDWNYPSVANWTKNSAPYLTKFDLKNGYLYVIGKEDAANGTAITLSEMGNAYSALNFSLGYKYVLYDPSSSSWVDMTSSHGNTPAQISLVSYKFTALNAVTANTEQTISANTNTTYTNSVSACAYRGNTTLSYSNLSNAYKFIGWYEGSTSKNTTSSYTFYPTTATTIGARFEYRWALMGTMLNQNWGTDNYITHITRNGSGQDVGYVDLVLPGNSEFIFKVVDRAATTSQWWSCNGETFEYNIDNNVPKTCTNVGTESNMTFKTAAPGTYRFTWNTGTHTLTVTYPTSYTVTYGFGTGGSVVTASGSSSGSIASGNYVASGENVTFTQTPAPGYSFKEWYTTADGSTNVSGMSTKDYVLDDVTADKTVYAQYNTVPLTFDNNGGSGNSNWDVAANWDPECVPTIKHDITITKPVVVNITDAKAKSVKIYNHGDTHTGKLTIGAGKALVVAEDIKKTEDGSTKIATTADVLHIEAGSTSVANGALVWGTSGTPGAAQVDFFTKSHGVKNSDESINQYIGTPFSNDQSILYQYYYSWLFKIKRTDGVLSWDLMSGDDYMNEFEGYNLITAYDANTTYQMEGTLVSNADVTLNGSSTPALVYSVSGGAGNANNENVLANSWVAPIKIAALTGFSNVESTIYIFNAGSEKQGSGGTGDTPGNYSTYSISEAGNAVIPSMQSFSVYATGENPSITLNYNTIVKSPLSSAYNNSTNKAPARNRADEMDLLKVRIDCENGWADELKIYIHEDFSNAFEDSWDAHKMYGYPEAPQLYAVTTDGNMAINCVPTADNNVLGFTPGSEDNEYTFSFTYDGDEEYYLKDTKLNIETLINTEATYTFTSEAEDSEMRFIIIKRAPAVATDVETVSGDRLAVSGVQKIMHNGQLYIIRDGGIYDATGTMVK